MKKILLISILVLMTFSVAYQSQAGFFGTFSNELLNNAQISTDEEVNVGRAGQLIGDFIQNILAFLGAIILVFIIYGGFLWLTAGGSEEQVNKAKKFLTNAVIGAIIIGLAYLITSWILQITQ